MTTEHEDDIPFLAMTPIGEEEDGLMGFPNEGPSLEQGEVREVEQVTDVTQVTEAPIVETEEVTVEEVPFTDEVSDVDPLVAIANGMVEKGYFNEIPDGVDVTKFNEEAFWQVMQHNIEKSTQDTIAKERQALASAITDTTRQILSYDIENPNATDEEVLDFLRGTVHANQITSLDPENNPEQIIREYYTGIGWTTEEINNEVTDLVERDKMVEKATALKPKLDVKAKALTEEKIRQQRMIADSEAKQYNNLQRRTVDILNTNKLFDIDLTREEAQIAYNAVLNQDVQVPVRGGKTMKLGAMEAMIYKNRYDQQGSLENLMLAAIIMEKGPKGLERFLGKKASEKVIGTFMRESKASALSKAGHSKVNQEPSDRTNGLFRLNFNSKK